MLDIFIPYWGDPSLMRQTVRSVLEQDCADWQLTIVDDAYPSREIEEWVAEQAHPRVAYHRKPTNEGITANYRTCIAMATEPLMTMLGSDDRLLPNYVRSVLDAHAHFPQAAIVQPGVRVIDESGAVVSTVADRVKQRLMRPRGGGYQPLCGEALAASLLTGNWLYWPSLTFRTDVVRRFELLDGLPIVQDLALVLDMVFAGEQLLVVPDVAFEYRRHSASASASTLLDGERFAGDRTYLAMAEQRAGELGWTRAQRAARLRLTARAHAALMLPASVARRDRAGIGSLVRHAFGA